MSGTKKVGSTGRYGVRYGRGIKKRLLSIEKISKRKHLCKSCMNHTLKREASGIWKCRKCGAKYAGKAYEPGI